MSLGPFNQNNINENQTKNRTINEPTNPILLEANIRTKRLYHDNLSNENYFKKEIDINKNERIEQISIQKENKESTKSITNSSINNNEITQDNEYNREILKNQFYELKEMQKNEESREFYLVPRKWYNKFNEYIKLNLWVNIKQLKGKMDNNECLIDKNIFENALFLNDEKNNIKILKPKYVFYQAIKPFSINKDLWEFLHHNFGVGPEIKMYSERIEKEGKFFL